MSVVRNNQFGATSLLLVSSFMTTGRETSAQINDLRESVLTAAVVSDSTESNIEIVKTIIRGELKELKESARSEIRDISFEIKKINDKINEEMVPEIGRFSAMITVLDEITALQAAIADQLLRANIEDLNLTLGNILALKKYFLDNEDQNFRLTNNVFANFAVEEFLDHTLEDNRLLEARFNLALKILENSKPQSDRLSKWYNPLLACHMAIDRDGGSKTETFKEFRKIIKLLAAERLNTDEEQLKSYGQYCSFGVGILSADPTFSMEAKEFFILAAEMIKAEPAIRTQTSYLDKELFNQTHSQIIRTLNLGFDKIEEDLLSNQNPAPAIRCALALLPEIKNTDIKLQTIICDNFKERLLSLPTSRDKLLLQIVLSAKPDTTFSDHNNCNWGKYTLSKIFIDNQDFFKAALKDYKENLKEAASLDEYIQIVDFLYSVEQLGWTDLQLAPIYQEFNKSVSEIFPKASSVINDQLFQIIAKDVFNLTMSDLRVEIDQADIYKQIIDYSQAERLEELLFKVLDRRPEYFETFSLKMKEVLASEVFERRIAYYRCLRAVGAAEIKYNRHSIFDLLTDQIALESNPRALLELGQSMGAIWNLHAKQSIFNLKEEKLLRQYGFSPTQLTNICTPSAKLFNELPEMFSRQQSLEEIKERFSKEYELKVQDVFMNIIAGVVGDQDSLEFFQAEAIVDISPIELRHRLTLVLAGAIKTQMEPNYKNTIIGILNDSFFDFGNSQQLGERLAALFEVYHFSDIRGDNTNDFQVIVAEFYKNLMFEGFDLTIEVNDQPRKYHYSSVLELYLETLDSAIIEEKTKFSLGIADNFLQTTSGDRRTVLAREKFLITLGYSGIELTQPGKVLEIFNKPNATIKTK